MAVRGGWGLGVHEKDEAQGMIALVLINSLHKKGGVSFTRTIRFEGPVAPPAEDIKGSFQNDPHAQNDVHVLIYKKMGQVSLAAFNNI